MSGMQGMPGSCLWCTCPERMQQLLPDSLSSPRPAWLDTVHQDLLYCWDCVLEYHHGREEVRRARPELAKVLTQKEVARLEETFILSLDHDDNMDDAVSMETLHLPLLEVLKFPYLLLHEKLAALVERAIQALSRSGRPLILEEKSAGIYLLLVHPNRQIRKWAIKSVRSLGMVHPHQYEEIEPVVGWLLSVVNFDLFENPGIALDVDDPPCGMEDSVVLPPFLFDTCGYKDYWLGICLLLSSLDPSTMRTQMFGARGHRHIPDAVLNAMEPQQGMKAGGFWPALQCLVVLFDRLGSRIWQFLSHDPATVFSTITKNPLFQTELLRLETCQGRKSSGAMVSSTSKQTPTKSQPSQLPASPSLFLERYSVKQECDSSCQSSTSFHKQEPIRDIGTGEDDWSSSQPITDSQAVYEAADWSLHQTNEAIALRIPEDDFPETKLYSNIPDVLTDQTRATNVHTCAFTWFIPYVSSLIEFGEIAGEHISASVMFLAEQADHTEHGTPSHQCKLVEQCLMVLLHLLELLVSKDMHRLLLPTCRIWVSLALKHCTGQKVSNKTMWSLAKHGTHGVNQTCLKLLVNLLKQGVKLRQDDRCVQFLDKLNLQLLRKRGPDAGDPTSVLLSEVDVQEMQKCMEGILKAKVTSNEFSAIASTSKQSVSTRGSLAVVLSSLQHGQSEGTEVLPQPIKCEDDSMTSPSAGPSRESFACEDDDVDLLTTSSDDIDLSEAIKSVQRELDSLNQLEVQKEEDHPFEVSLSVKEEPIDAHEESSKRTPGIKSGTTGKPHHTKAVMDSDSLLLEELTSLYNESVAQKGSQGMLKGVSLTPTATKKSKARTSPAFNTDTGVQIKTEHQTGPFDGSSQVSSGSSRLQETEPPIHTARKSFPSSLPVVNRNSSRISSTRVDTTSPVESTKIRTARKSIMPYIQDGGSKEPLPSSKRSAKDKTSDLQNVCVKLEKEPANVGWNTVRDKVFDPSDSEDSIILISDDDDDNDEDDDVKDDDDDDIEDRMTKPVKREQGVHGNRVNHLHLDLTSSSMQPQVLLRKLSPRTIEAHTSGNKRVPQHCTNWEDSTSDSDQGDYPMPKGRIGRRKMFSSSSDELSDIDSVPLSTLAQMSSTKADSDIISISDSDEEPSSPDREPQGTSASRNTSKVGDRWKQKILTKRRRNVILCDSSDVEENVTKPSLQQAVKMEKDPLASPGMQRKIKSKVSRLFGDSSSESEGEKGHESIKEQCRDIPPSGTTNVTNQEKSRETVSSKCSNQEMGQRPLFKPEKTTPVSSRIFNKLSLKCRQIASQHSTQDSQASWQPGQCKSQPSVSLERRTTTKSGSTVDKYGDEGSIKHQTDIIDRFAFHASDSEDSTGVTVGSGKSAIWSKVQESPLKISTSVASKIRCQLLQNQHRSSDDNQRKEQTDDANKGSHSSKEPKEGAELELTDMELLAAADEKNSGTDSQEDTLAAFLADDNAEDHAYLMESSDQAWMDSESERDERQKSFNTKKFYKSGRKDVESTSQDSSTTLKRKESHLDNISSSAVAPGRKTAENNTNKKRKIGDQECGSTITSKSRHTSREAAHPLADTWHREDALEATNNVENDDNIDYDEPVYFDFDLDEVPEEEQEHFLAEKFASSQETPKKTTAHKKKSQHVQASKKLIHGKGGKRAKTAARLRLTSRSTMLTETMIQTRPHSKVNADRVGPARTSASQSSSLQTITNQSRALETSDGQSARISTNQAEPAQTGSNQSEAPEAEPESASDKTAITQVSATTPFASYQQKPAVVKKPVIKELPAPKVDPSKPINPDYFLTCILQWNPQQMEGSSRKELPIPCHDLQPIPQMFGSFDDYLKTFTPLLLLETWEMICKEWESANSKGPIAKMKLTVGTCFEARCLQLIHTQTLLKKQAPSPSEGDLLVLSSAWRGDLGQEGLTQAFGVVEKVTKQPNIGGSYDYWKLTVCIKVNGTTFPVTEGQTITIQPVTSLVACQRQWSGLTFLHRSLLARDILRPRGPSVFAVDTDPSQRAHVVGRYNPMQRAAIAGAAHSALRPFPLPRICLLQGPPGTGKSHTIVGLVKKIIQAGETPPDGNPPTPQNSKPRVLLCAPSNAGIDELVRRMIRDVHEGEEEKENKRRFYKGNCGDLNLVRLGRPASIHPDAQGFSLDNIVEKQLQSFTKEVESSKERHIVVQLTALDVKIADLERECGMQRLMGNTQKQREVERKRDALQAQRDKLDKTNRQVQLKNEERHREGTKIRQRVLMDADVVCCTLSASGSNMLEQAITKAGVARSIHFTCVIIDEAGQCNELDALIPLQYGMSKLILVGDPEQLPATVLSKKAQDLNFRQSLFERLYRVFKPRPDNPVLMLNTQYRMHPAICGFPSYNFYSGKLRTDKDVAEDRRRCSFKPYVVFNMLDGREQESRMKAGGIYNHTEAVMVAQLVIALKENPAIDTRNIGVITPYQKQKWLIETQLIRSGNNQVEVGTVDGFQGREKDIVILSCVRACSSSGSIGFLCHRQRMNVALTRAKFCLYVVCHEASLRTNLDWHSCMEDARRREVLVDVKGLGSEEDFHQLGRAARLNVKKLCPRPGPSAITHEENKQVQERRGENDTKLKKGKTAKEKPGSQHTATLKKSMQSKGGKEQRHESDIPAHSKKGKHYEKKSSRDCPTSSKGKTTNAAKGSSQEGRKYAAEAGRKVSAKARKGEATKSSSVNSSSKESSKGHEKASKSTGHRKNVAHNKHKTSERTSTVTTKHGTTGRHDGKKRLPAQGKNKLSGFKIPKVVVTSTQESVQSKSVKETPTATSSGKETPATSSLVKETTTAVSTIKETTATTSTASTSRGQVFPLDSILGQMSSATKEDDVVANGFGSGAGISNDDVSLRNGSKEDSHSVHTADKANSGAVENRQALKRRGDKTDDNLRHFKIPRRNSQDVVHVPANTSDGSRQSSSQAKIGTNNNKPCPVDTRGHTGQSSKVMSDSQQGGHRARVGSVGGQDTDQREVNHLRRGQHAKHTIQQENSSNIRSTIVSRTDASGRIVRTRWEKLKSVLKSPTRRTSKRLKVTFDSSIVNTPSNTRELTNYCGSYEARMAEMKSLPNTTRSDVGSFVPDEADNFRNTQAFQRRGALSVTVNTQSGGRAAQLSHSESELPELSSTQSPLKDQDRSFNHSLRGNPSQEAAVGNVRTGGSSARSGNQTKLTSSHQIASDPSPRSGAQGNRIRISNFVPAATTRRDSNGTVTFQNHMASASHQRERGENNSSSGTRSNYPSIITGQIARIPHSSSTSNPAVSGNSTRDPRLARVHRGAMIQPP
ncbi:probable helicase senataxin isoform X2 [Branchiostoma floridae]|uniref:Probable helicase senataxin isoform X2 n=1 Tax=Branchiostoma floridae TaxID=7739 RepID=A0A9J7LMX0_BRAFL|nr:probable helicase senataxin isoform X2 [Branchiostoma floridae]